MKIRTFLLVMVLVAIAAFVALFWSARTTPTDLPSSASEV